MAADAGALAEGGLGGVNLGAAKASEDISRCKLNALDSARKWIVFTANTKFQTYLSQGEVQEGGRKLSVELLPHYHHHFDPMTLVALLPLAPLQGNQRV